MAGLERLDFGLVRLPFQAPRGYLFGAVVRFQLRSSAPALSSPRRGSDAFL